jgi:hypothetical protein
MDLNNNNLYKKHDQLVQLKKETYEKLYNRCKNTIKLTSDAGELICLFEIPKFLFGSSYPIINIQSCANYIMNKLLQANHNIKTTFIEPNIIFIDWRRKCDMQFYQTDQTKKISKISPSTNSSEKSFLSSSMTSPKSTTSKKSNSYK